MQKIERAIMKFEGAFFFLSNFFPSRLDYEKHSWPTLEHAYQAAKSADPEIKRQILCARTAGMAKTLGNSCKLIANWENLKNDIMKTLIDLKFAEGSKLAERLLSTQNAELIEGNNWGDRYWGVDTNGHGENWLGKILMQRRKELQTLKYEKVGQGEIGVE